MSSVGYVWFSRVQLKAFLTMPDTIKVRMQLSRRARAPGVCHPTNPLQMDNSIAIGKLYTDAPTRRQSAALSKLVPKLSSERLLSVCTRDSAPF